MTLPPDSTSADKIADTALNIMRSHHIPPTPENYAVWYSHYMRNCPSLSALIERYIAGNTTFNDAINQSLYEHYCNHAAQAGGYDYAMNNTHHVLNDALETITSIISEADSHNHTIQGKLDTIIVKKDSDNIATVIEALVAVAKEMKKGSADMRRNLEESRQEVEGLKQNLADMSVQLERDFLTNVYNRQALDNMLARHMRQSATSGEALSLLMIDIDHFKEFNDNFGHLIGDEVLKMVGKILTDSVKGKDIVARFGGEEFAVLLPATPLGNAMIVAEHIRSSIGNKELMHRGSGSSFGHVTVSVGVAAFNAQDDAQKLIKRADDALYRSKHAGRNRVTQEVIGDAIKDAS